jgi:hypothetical protein
LELKTYEAVDKIRLNPGAFSELSQLISLRICTTHLREFALALADLRGLRELSFSGIFHDHLLLEAAAQLPLLSALELGSGRVSATEFRLLRSMPELRRLKGNVWALDLALVGSLPWSSLTVQVHAQGGFEKLWEWVQQGGAAQLSELVIRGAGLPSPTIPEPLLLELQSSLPKLQFMEFYNVVLTDTARQQLQQLTQLTGLVLGDIPASLGADVGDLPHGLHRLKVRGGSSWFEQQQVCRVLSKLTSLDLSGSFTCDTAMLSLSNLQHLRELTLLNTSVSPVGLGYLSELNNLSRLSLSCPVGDGEPEVVAALAALGGLQHLELRGTGGVTLPAAMALASGLRHLSTLELYPCRVRWFRSRSPRKVSKSHTICTWCC